MATLIYGWEGVTAKTKNTVTINLNLDGYNAMKPKLKKRVYSRYYSIILCINFGHKLLSKGCKLYAIQDKSQQ